MLQINTGKFFTVDEVRTNELRGVLHTNLRVPNRESIVTVAGTLHATNALANTGAVIFEMTERLEGGIANCVIAWHGIDPYPSQFAQVASFGLNGICALDHSGVERLTSRCPLLDRLLGTDTVWWIKQSYVDMTAVCAPVAAPAPAAAAARIPSPGRKSRR